MSSCDDIRHSDSRSIDHANSLSMETEINQSYFP